MLRRNFLLSVGALALFPTTTLAERRPTTISKDARVRHVWYNSTDVIRIDSKLRINTAIELGSGERIEQVLLGDSESYQVQVLGNKQTISLKPVYGGANTNMTVYTSRRAISFMLTEGAVATPTYRVVVRFGDAQSTKKPQLVEGGRDLAYEFAKKKPLTPLRIWNDGRSTFFEFKKNQRPSIFGVNPDGYETTTLSQTASFSNSVVVKVSGVATYFTIRLGREYVCVKRVKGKMHTDANLVAALRSREF